MSGEAFRRRPAVFSWARMVRAKCSECQCPHLEWGILRDLAWEVEPGERLRVFELIDFLGEGAESWYCPACGAWGSFEAGSTDEGWTL